MKRRPSLPLDNAQQPIQVLAPIGTHERLCPTGGVATGSSNTFDKGQIVRFYTDEVDVYVSFVGDAVTGTTGNSFPLANDSPEYFVIHGDDVQISVIGGDIDINVCE